MKEFKFFQKEERVFTQWMDEMDDYHLGGIRHAVEVPRGYLISEEDINLAISRGRQSYLNGDNLEVTPYLTPELIRAFEEGWELEHDYDILRQAQQRGNENI
jgi:ribosome modulation factor